MKNTLFTLSLLAAFAGAHFANAIPVGTPMGTALIYRGRLNDGGAALLKITLIANGQAVLAWPVSASGFVLEECGGLTRGLGSPRHNTSWTPPANTPSPCPRPESSSVIG